MKHSKKRFKNIYLFISFLVLIPSLLVNGTYAKAEGNTVTKTITFTQSKEQSQSKTITIPNLLEVLSASVDNGDVSYQVNGNDITIHVTNGTGIKVQTGGEYIPPDSKTVTTTRSTSPGGDPNKLPSSIVYNSDGYTGTLTKSGSAKVTSGSYTPESSKTVTVTQSGTFHCDWESDDAKKVSWHAGGGWWVTPETITYNSGGYYGILPWTEQTHVSCETVKPDYPAPVGTHKNPTTSATLTYSGTVTRPASDTRVWTQTYSGTVTKPAVDTRTYETRYAYIVTFAYSVWDINLSSVPKNVTFPSITLNGQQQQITTNISDPLIVKDDGHTDWYMTVMATQFTDDKGHMLPKNSLQLTLPNKIDVLNIEENQQTTISIDSPTFFIDGPSNTIFTMNPTSNVVTQYTFKNIGLTLNLNPGSTFVDTETGSSTYHSTITWTVVSGP